MVTRSIQLPDRLTRPSLIRAEQTHRQLADRHRSGRWRAVDADRHAVELVEDHRHRPGRDLVGPGRPGRLSGERAGVGLSSRVRSPRAMSTSAASRAGPDAVVEQGVGAGGCRAAHRPGDDEDGAVASERLVDGVQRSRRWRGTRRRPPPRTGGDDAVAGGEAPRERSVPERHLRDEDPPWWATASQSRWWRGDRRCRDPCRPRRPPGRPAGPEHPFVGGSVDAERQPRHHRRRRPRRARVAHLERGEPTAPGAATGADDGHPGSPMRVEDRPGEQDGGRLEVGRQRRGIAVVAEQDRRRSRRDGGLESLGRIEPGRGTSPTGRHLAGLGPIASATPGCVERLRRSAPPPMPSAKPKAPTSAVEPPGPHRRSDARATAAATGSAATQTTASASKRRRHVAQLQGQGDVGRPESGPPRSSRSARVSARRRMRCRPRPVSWPSRSDPSRSWTPRPRAGHVVEPSAGSSALHSHARARGPGASSWPPARGPGRWTRRAGRR
jgi:hypothetical protein